MSYACGDSEASSANRRHCQGLHSENAAQHGGEECEAFTYQQFAVIQLALSKLGSFCFYRPGYLARAIAASGTQCLRSHHLATSIIDARGTRVLH
eukprot:6367955-Amphidinium_carterae.1